MANPNILRQIYSQEKPLINFIVNVAWSVPSILMMCGYVRINGQRLEYHDHPPSKETYRNFVNGPYVSGRSNELYDESKHGPIEGFVKEGEIVPGIPNSTLGKTPVHRHNLGREGNSSGSYEYRYE